ncbi:MAG: M81 family metallopeptidase, partial [Bacteroidales bacterium]|nr:M81 family metallopeptidase [Bacteroidales bacterium]
MRNLGFVLISGLVILGMACVPGTNKESSDLPRVAICGLAIESSTFSPAVTHTEAFRIRRGDEIFSYYPFVDENSENRKRAEWFPALRGHAIPGGIVTRAAYDSLVNETLA